MLNNKMEGGEGEGGAHRLHARTLLIRGTHKTYKFSSSGHGIQLTMPTPLNRI